MNEVGNDGWGYIWKRSGRPVSQFPLAPGADLSHRSGRVLNIHDANLVQSPWGLALVGNKTWCVVLYYLRVLAREIP